MPYFLGRAMKQFYPSAKVLLCGEGADEFFIGYPLFLDSKCFWSSSIDALRAICPERTTDSPLLRQVWQWESMRPEEAWFSIVDMFQRDQLVNLHLVPFDHGTMAHGVECRVPFLDYGVVQFIQRMPAHLRVLGKTTKVLLRILLAQALGRHSATARTLLTRSSSPAFLTTVRCRDWLKQFVRANLTHKLADSPLVKLAIDEENFFWLGSVAIIFMKHRGQIDGMRFADLANEVFTEVTNTTAALGNPVRPEKNGAGRS
jgi:asparagine synthetase B (glutamine-hydrolysing)